MGHFGPNVSPIRVIHDVKISGESFTRQKYSFRPGWQAFSTRLSLYRSYSDLCRRKLCVYHVRLQEHRFVWPSRDVVEFTDRQNWVTIPVVLKYSGVTGRIRPYGLVGYSANLLLSDHGNITVINRDQKVGEEALNAEDSESPTLVFTNKRRFFNQSVVFGGRHNDEAKAQLSLCRITIFGRAYQCDE